MCSSDLQPHWRDRLGLDAAAFPVADDAWRSSISLPIFPGLTDDELARVIAAVARLLT